MATIQDLENALVRAHKAGDTDSARKLAAFINEARKDPANLIPGTPVIWETKPEPTAGEKVVGAGEAALALATGATGGTAGMIGGTVKGIAQSILEGSFGTPEATRMVEESAAKASQALTFAPRTEAGQQMTQAAGQALSEVLPPTLPIIGQAGQLATSSKMAALPTEAAIRAAAPVVKETAARAGQAAKAGISRIASAVQGTEEAAAKGPQSVGAAATPEALRRVTTAESLPVPITMTRGAATREAGQLAFEKEQMKSALGGPLRNRAEENNLQVLQNFDALLDMTDSKITDISTTGNAVTNALAKGLAAAKNKTRVAYQKARNSPEADAPVNPGSKVDFEIDGSPTQMSVIDYLNSKPIGIPSSGVTDSIRGIGKKLAIFSEDQDGNLVALPSNVRKMEDFRREISGIAKFDDRVGVRDETILKKLVDLQTEPVAGELFKKARSLREQQARKYENRAIVARLVSNRKNMEDPVVAADKVFRASISNASPEEITFLKRVLQTSGKDGKQAWNELQGATVRYIRDEATKGLARDSSGRPMISPAQLNNTIRRLDENGRLDVIFGKKNAQLMRDINEVLKDVTTVPPGTLINTSGTAGTLLAALAESGATGALTGLPLPVATGIRQIMKMKKERATKAKIAEALNALPTIQP